MFQCQYVAGDGASIPMTKVCHHNWAGSPEGDGCHADTDGNCAWIADNEWAVCYHTDFKGPCPLVPSPCRINGATCVIMDKRQAVVRRKADDAVSIFNGDSQTGEKPGIQNPKFAFDRPHETALVIMDMWNHHPYIDSQNRVGELAPMIDSFATRLRNEGVLIIHSCSSPNDQVGAYYSNLLKNDPNSPVSVARRRGKSSVSNDVPSHLGGGSSRIRGNFYSIDDLTMWNSFFFVVDQGSPRGGGEEPSQEHPAIAIEGIDALSADGLDDDQGSQLGYQQLLGLTANRPNLIYVGVHTNQCILRRHNGMRTMHRAGKSLWIVRDLTDCVSNYNTSQILHFSQTDMVVDFIGHHLGAETLTTEQAGGNYIEPKTKRRFRFEGDDREG